MAPESIFERARDRIPCHPNASLMIGDAWKIDPSHYECQVICSRCGRCLYMDISRLEYRQMDNTRPWEFEQEWNHFHKKR